MKSKIKALQQNKTVLRAKGKVSDVFNSKAFKVAAVVKETAFCAALGAAAATGVLAPLSAAIMTTSHGMALSKNIRKLMAAAPRRRHALGYTI